MKFIFISSLLIVLAVQAFTRCQAAETPEYQSPSFKEKINQRWSFKALATIVKDGVNNNLEIPWNIIKNLKEGDVNTAALVETVVQDELPLLLPAVIGVMCAFLVPIITLLFCCCRCCCGNCGGKLTAADISKQKMFGLICNAFVVLAAAGIILAMAFGVPMSGKRVKETPIITVDSLKYSAHDFPIFVSTFVQESRDMVINHLNDSVESVKSLIRDLPNVLSGPLIDSTSGFIDQIEHDVNAIQTEVDSLQIVESETDTTVDTVTTHLDNLEKILNDLNANLTSIKNKCVTDGELFCDSLPAGSGDPVNFDTAPLTDMASMISQLVNETQNVNLTGYMAMGTTTFEAIPEIIQNSSSSSMNEVISTLDGVPDLIIPEVDEALDMVSNMTEKLSLDEMVVDLEQQVDDIDAMIDPIFNMAMKIIGAYFGIIAGTAVLGLLMGILCRGKASGPSQGRGGWSSCGASCLMCSVFLAVLVIVFVLLLGSVFLIIGGNATIFCKTIQEVTIVKKLIENELLFDGNSLGQVIFDNDQIDISIQGFMDNCRAGGTLFSSFNISKMFNLTDMFNVTEFVPELTDDMFSSIEDTINNIDVFDVSFLDDIASQLEFPADTSTGEIQIMKDEINNFDLLALSSDMTEVANSLTDPWYYNYYKSIAATLTTAHFQTKIPLLISVNDLESKLTDLSATGVRIQLAVTDLRSTLEGMQNFIQTKAVEVIFESINNFLADMIQVPAQFVDNVLHTLTTDVGQCKIVGDMYDSITGSFCVWFLDSFNVLWAGLYVGGLTFIFLMIANCRLGQYFRPANANSVLSDDYSHNASGRNDVVLQMDYITRPVGSDINNNSTNNATTTFTSSSKLKQLRDYVANKRHRFSTGSKSPQLLRISQLKQSLKAAREKREARPHGERTEFYQRIQPKIEPRQGWESDEEQELLTAGSADSSDGATAGDQSKVMVDASGDGGEITIHVDETCNVAMRQNGPPLFSTFKQVAEHEFNLVPIVSTSYQNRPSRSRDQSVNMPDNAAALNSNTDAISESQDEEEIYPRRYADENSRFVQVQRGVDRLLENSRDDDSYVYVSELPDIYIRPSVVRNKSHSSSERVDISGDNSHETSLLIGMTDDFDDYFDCEDSHQEGSTVYDDGKQDSKNDYQDCRELNSHESCSAFEETDRQSVSDGANHLFGGLKITCLLCRGSAMATDQMQANCQPDENKLSNPHAGQSLTCNDKASLLKYADSFADHLNDFEAVYKDLSGMSDFTEPAEELGFNRNVRQCVCTKNKTRTFPRNSGKVLDIQVKPYTGMETVEKSSIDDSHDTAETVKEFPESNATDSWKPLATSTLSTLNPVKPDTHVHQPSNDHNKSQGAVDHHPSTAIAAVEQTRPASGSKESGFNQSSLADLAEDISRHVTVGENKAANTGRSAQSLHVLASKALLATALSRVIPKETVLSYGSASTEKSSSKLTYM